MLILLKIAAILALIILPLVPPKKKTGISKNTEVSDLVVDEDGDIRTKDDDKNLRQNAGRR
ncbi:hypothetical protein ACFGVR_03990 [Mucilaginibacter sp. AW1-3]